MPIDPKRRASDLENALTLMVQMQGDEPLNGIVFRPSDDAFKGLAPTTWQELEDAGLIEDRGEKPGPTFRLTPEGWLAGLRVSGAFDTPAVRDRAVAIRRSLKGRIKGRSNAYPEHVHFKDLALELGQPAGWVWTAMRANLLEAIFPDHLMNATLDRRHHQLIEIPSTFDMQRSAPVR